ncbi:hypothetical protein HKX48_008903, partial [Thoreauomyces humboldtii]
TIITNPSATFHAFDPSGRHPPTPLQVPVIASHSKEVDVGEAVVESLVTVEVGDGDEVVSVVAVEEEEDGGEVSVGATLELVDSKEDVEATVDDSVMEEESELVTLPVLEEKELAVVDGVELTTSDVDETSVKLEMVDRSVVAVVEAVDVDVGIVSVVVGDADDSAVKPVVLELENAIVEELVTVVDELLLMLFAAFHSS